MPRLPSRLKQVALFMAMTVTVASLGFNAAMAENAVLLASTVPGYVPGMVISSTDQLSLPDGASATLLFQSGETLRLRGPFEGMLGQPQTRAASGNAALLAEMFRQHGVDATVIGGTRSTRTTSSKLSLDDVQVDSQRSGIYCVQLATAVWIARPVNETGAYALRRRGNSRTLNWQLGAIRTEWPVDVPIEDGSQFEIVVNGAARATVTFYTISSTATSSPAKVASGLLLGCHDQFDDELKQLSRTIVGPEVWLTTDRGRRPIYRAGEPIVLTAVVNMDGYLYCVISNDRDAKPLFPAGAVNGALLSTSMPLSIPGRRQPIGPMAAPGLEQIRCWLADRDIAPELPHALLGTLSTRLPDQLSGNLDAIFSNVSGTHIAADGLTIRVE